MSFLLPLPPGSRLPRVQNSSGRTRLSLAVIRVQTLFLYQDHSLATGAHLFYATFPRRRGLHIVRDDFFTKVISHSFRRSSSPNRTRCAGLRFGFGYKPESCSIYRVVMLQKARRNFDRITAGFLFEDSTRKERTASWMNGRLPLK